MRRKEVREARTKFNMNIKEMGCEDDDRVDLAQDRDQWRTLGHML